MQRNGVEESNGIRGYTKVEIKSEPQHQQQQKQDDTIKKELEPFQKENNQQLLTYSGTSMI